MIIGVIRRFFNSLLGVEYPGETLSLVFDMLHDNCSYTSFFSTFFPVLDILMKHSHSCLIYYRIIGVTRHFSTLFSMTGIQMKHALSFLISDYVKCHLPLQERILHFLACLSFPLH